MRNRIAATIGASALTLAALTGVAAAAAVPAFAGTCPPGYTLTVSGTCMYHHT